jgi:1,4-dihydroxy-2-naphthoate polyprenyltransferase
VIMPFVFACGIAAWRFGSLLALVALPIAIAPIRRVREGAVGRDLIPVLGDTGRTQLAFGVMLAVGIWL